MMRPFLLLLTLHCSAGDTNKAKTPYDMDQMVIKGDFVLGAIFPIRSYGRTENTSYSYKQCGELQSSYVLQSEAFRLSLEYVNERVLKPHGYTLGGLVVDECDNAVIGLQSAVRLMAGEFGVSNWGICSRFPKGAEMNRTFIFGMTGGTNSVISERVEPLLEVFCLPLISTYATSHVFDDAQTYQYFLRTVPSDVYQAKAVYDLLKEMDWYTVAVIYEKTPYGIGLYESFRSYVGSNGADNKVCIATAIAISNEDPKFQKTMTDVETSGVFVVVLFTDFTTATGIFNYLKITSNRRKYQWVGTDGWGRSEAPEGVEAEVENTMTTEFYSHHMPLMENFVRNLTFQQAAQSKNPWLQELIRQDNNCSEGPLGHFCQEHPPDAKVTFRNPDAGLGRSYYIFEAVYSFAAAFEELRKTHCSNEEYGGLCEEFYEKANGTQLMDALRRVKIHAPDQLPGDFSFFNNSGPPNYSVYQFQYVPGDGYQWVPIGEWTDLAGLRLAETCASNSKPGVSPCVNIIRPFQTTQNYCRPLCKENNRRDAQGECCWQCEQCQEFEYVNATGQACEKCRLGEKPNQMFNDCMADELVYLGKEHHQNLFWPFFLALVIGILGSFFLTTIFISYRRTAAASLASYPLCLIATLGIVALFGSTVLSMARPSDALCVAQWSLQPFFLTLISAAIFVRTFQFSRENWSDLLYATDKRACAMSKSKSIELLIICIVEVVIITVVYTFLLITPNVSSEIRRDPAGMHVRMERVTGQTVIACAHAMDLRATFILLIMPVILLSISIIFAIRRWKCRVVYERREQRRVVWSCGTVFIFLLFMLILVLTIAKTPIQRTSMQVATMIVCGFVFLLHYTPMACIMLSGHKNTPVHLTRDVKDDERIRSDQLTLADDVIGEGYFCEVIRGKYRRNKRQTLDVAAKRAKKTLTNRADLLDLTNSVYQEILILRHVRGCENIIRLYGVCNDVEPEPPILVLEYVNGDNCHKFIPPRRRQLQNVDLLSIAANISNALCFLKEKSIVHRDVRCANCLVQERAAPRQQTGSTGSQPSRLHAKLADFGVAVEANRGRVDSTGKRLFPARHTAPEGFLSRFSYESDVWSFGVFVWEVYALMNNDNPIPYENVHEEDIEGHIAAGNILPQPHAAPGNLYENIMKPCWPYDPSARIAITRLKQLLTATMRRVPSNGSTNGYINGSTWYGSQRQASALSLSTPNLLDGDPRSPPHNTHQLQTRANTGLGKDYYRNPSLSFTNIAHMSTFEFAPIEHRLLPSVIVVNNEDRNARPVTPLYRKFT